MLLITKKYPIFSCKYDLSGKNNNFQIFSVQSFNLINYVQCTAVNLKNLKQMGKKYDLKSFKIKIKHGYKNNN